MLLIGMLLRTDRARLNDRIDVVTGDMFTDPLPSGFDAHLYSHVLHDWAPSG